MADGECGGENQLEILRLLMAFNHTFDEVLGPGNRARFPMGSQSARNGKPIAGGVKLLSSCP
jgi:hypothetical protein